MSDEARALERLLAGSALAGRPVSCFALPRSGEHVLAVKTDPAALTAEWSVARGLLDQTGRWPVASTSWSTRGTELRDWSFWMDPRGEKQLPPLARQAAASLSGVEALAAIGAARRPDEPLDEMLEFHLDATRRRCGDAPDPAAVRAALAPDATEADLDGWLLAWEETRTPTAGPEHADVDDWYYPEPEYDETYLLFLPTRVGPDALAYIEFNAEDGVAGATTERLIAVLSSWHERYGAQLVAHWGTMLQFAVSRPPQSLDDAWELAGEHELIAPGTDPTTVRRDCARWLWQRPTWFLHERP